jgi:hypothetical protein
VDSWNLDPLAPAQSNHACALQVPSTNKYTFYVHVWSLVEPFGDPFPFSWCVAKNKFPKVQKPKLFFWCKLQMVCLDPWNVDPLALAQANHVFPKSKQNKQTYTK